MEIAAADVDPAVFVAGVGAFLDSLGAPRASAVLDGGGAVRTTFGSTDGLALYLNGTDLPDEVYAGSDTGELLDAISQALGDSGRMLSFWEGPRETALHLHGPSGEVMRSRLAVLLSSRADTQLSRLESIT